MGLYSEVLIITRILHVIFGGLISGRAYFWRGLLSEVYGISTGENIVVPGFCLIHDEKKVAYHKCSN